MKGQFVRLVTLNCSPLHPEAFILLTPAPKKCHADPLRVFMSELCLGATARSHFNSRTPLSGRTARCVLVCVRVWVFVRVYTHACIHVSAIVICHFWKRHKRAKCGWGSKKKKKKVFAWVKGSKKCKRAKKNGEKKKMGRKRKITWRLLLLEFLLQAFLWHFLAYFCSPGVKWKRGSSSSFKSWALLKKFWHFSKWGNVVVDKTFLEWMTQVPSRCSVGALDVLNLITY